MIESLNKKVSADCGLNLAFYTTSKASQTAEIVKDLLPLSKIAVLSTIDTDLQFINELKYALLKYGVKPICVFLKSAPLLDVNAVCDLFLLPEDVRGVIVVSKSLCKMAEYFSYVRKTPCFYFLYDGLPADFLFEYLCLKNSGRIDVIKKDFDRKIILSKTFINNFSAKDALEHFTVMLSILVDICVKKEARKVGCQVAINQILKKVETCIDAVYSNAESGDCALSAVLDVEMDFMRLGRESSLNAISALSFLVGKDCVVYNTMCTAYSILEVYKTKFSRKVDFTFPNYAERAKLVSYYGDIDCCECIKSIKEQAEIFSALKESDFDYSRHVIEEVNRIYGKISNYFKLKKKNQIDEQIILLAGDTPLGVNGMSLLREKSSLN
jgi:hypothetical protein